ncbi:amino acid ABC transporter substrate-binding protein [Streptococcus suis]|uniref:Amino acid ABC transporter substrate-binding protein n=1 Tax=Streptococcus suis TaxID=1307 RepID=A0A4T2GLE7_STRSU|nr:amino acid ABC transporter substrate-binding protein [Streptococcus suis]MBM7270095.1 amino acid ABC transporter substrate-binding protein [Streptococcus suis]TIH99489.1 amino acid ABC transporter substrate-binding protein [Streptococcus suis]
MKKMALFTSFVLASFALAACSTSSSTSTSSDQTLYEQIQAEGVIQIGTEGAYAPYSYHDESGKLVGYDVEVAEAVAAKLGLEVEFVETEWDGMIAGLDAARFDTVANQVSITDERKEKYDFSKPYTYIYGALVTQSSNQDITQFEDLSGKKSANSLTSNWATVAESYGAEVVGVDGFQQAVELLTAGRVDATINDNVVYLDYLKQHPDAAIQVVALTEDVQTTAFPVVKGNEELVAAIDQALADLAAEGKLTEIAEKYFGEDVSTAAE